MYELSKSEFNKWISTLKLDTLSPYKKTIIWIIVKNFDSIAKCGTTRGQRAKKIGEYIEKLDNKIPVSDISITDTKYDTIKIKRLSSLKVENFRGFGREENFDFSKQYTLFHGPNGSGKTSFCEAIEYSVLGNIEEATARGIPLNKYIKHAECKKKSKTELICENCNGEKIVFPTDYENYRFAFIEKNRILDFSHISATTEKNQVERIAALFGLSEFQHFVKEFTDTLDNRYLMLETDANDFLDKSNEMLSQKKKSLESLKCDVVNAEKNINEEIKKLNNEEIHTFEEANHYLNDLDTGLLSLAQERYNKRKDKISIKKLLDLLDLCNSFLSYKEKIDIGKEKIVSEVDSLNLSSLYEAVLKIKDSYKEKVCPVCNTPLENVIENPFKHAEAELKKFDEIFLIKKSLKENEKLLYSCYKNIIGVLKELQICNFLKEYIDISILTENEYDEDSLNNIIITGNLLGVINEIKNLLDNKDKNLIIIETYNKKVEMENDILAKEVNKYKELWNNLAGLSANINKANEDVEKCKKDIEKLSSTITSQTEEVKKINNKIEFNTKMAKAYDSIVKSLKSYVAKLPLAYSANLSEKAKEYYNYINYGDAEFELIETLKLPVTVKEKVEVKMYDTEKENALQILSEGHVKILGLSILLAKAITEKVPFIVFDDIVNAIDDDHRDGVASLLVEHEDFSNIQMILTCHGEIFLTKIDDYIKEKTKVQRYMFLPADTLNERGVLIKYQDSSVPIAVAKRKLEENQLKDCGAKCRQAVECIVGKLWKKVSSSSGGITVKIRNINSSPDLSNSVEALIKATKEGKIKDVTGINDCLKKLKENRMWTLLNKGTHVDDTLPEFTRREMKELVSLIERLSISVDSLKIKPTAVDDKN